MKKRVGKPVFFIVFLLIAVFTYVTFFGVTNYYGDTKQTYIKGAEDIRWGIDIRGGVEAIFSPDIDDSKITTANMDSAKTIIETRLINKNITDYEVYTDHDSHQIIVRFPWQSDEKDFDPAAAVAELGETAVLRFYEGQTNEKVVLEGAKDIKSASPAVDQETGAYVVQLHLTSAGKDKFAEATGRLKGSQISIWMDDVIISAPTVNDVITNGEAVITNIGDETEAKDLADKINAGSLPFALTVDDSKLQIVSPTLGAEALDIMIIACAVAFIAVCLLMILKYRLPGLIACIALMGQIAGIIAFTSGFFPSAESFTMTIPGIAGIVLSIGMGVDANVITSERVKEEFRKGKTIDGAIDAGYSEAWSSIFDGNITVAIVAVVLMGCFGTPGSIIYTVFSPIMRLFGTSVTGSIYSFGYSLLIGVLFNMIMGVSASRLMTKSISRFKFLRNPWLFGGAKNVQK